MSHYPKHNPELQDMRIVVISLIRATQRREKVQQELSRIRLEWSFLDAVDGSRMQEFPPEYKKNKVRRMQGYEMTPGEIGCFLSHKHAWQECMDKNQPTLIFEDDFVLKPHFEETLHFLLTKFHDWQLIRLQALAESSHDIITSADKFSVVRNHTDPVGATAYLVKPEAAKTLIAHAEDIYEPLDHYLEHKRKHGIEMLAVKPYPVDITRAQSTISDRPDIRKPIKGLRKKIRSFYRLLDRLVAKDPWFPK